MQPKTDGVIDCLRVNMLISAKIVVMHLLLHDNRCNEERGSHWSQQVSAVATTQWLQHDETIPFSATSVGCETRGPIVWQSHTQA